METALSTQTRTLAVASRFRDACFRSVVGRWNSALFHLLAASGAVTIVVASHMTWATFYAGLIERNGMAGHGKYFVGLAAASLLAVGLSRLPGVSRALLWTPLIAALLIGTVALRDLHNLNQLVGNPAAGLYVPGRGNGLYVVLVGSALLGLAVFAQADAPRLRPLRLAPTAAALLAVVGIALVIPGVYGEYYLHSAGRVAHQHTGGLDSAHLLTAGGVLALLASARFTAVTFVQSRRD
jgi:hypothetical protein